MLPTAVASDITLLNCPFIHLTHSNMLYMHLDPPSAQTNSLFSQCI